MSQEREEERAPRIIGYSARYGPLYQRAPITTYTRAYSAEYGELGRAHLIKREAPTKKKPPED